MNRSLLATLALGAFALGSVPVLAPGQSYTPPRTPWGDPDIQGVFTTDDSIDVPMQRPEAFGDRLFMNEEEYREAVESLQRQDARFSEEFAPENARVTVNPPGHWLEWGDEPSRQTSLVIDPPNGRIPPQVQAQGRGGRGRGRGAPAQSPEDFSLYIRCITRGVTGSILPVIYGNGTRIVQGPGYVAVANEMVHESRIIPLDSRPHPGENIRMYMGSSRGRWEGDTLVVETRNLTDRTGVSVNGGGTTHSEDLVITERFSRTAPDRIHYEATIDDPRTWTAPWTMGFDLIDKPDYQVYEYACHEGNNAMRNMLSAARVQEAAAGGDGGQGGQE